MSKTPPCVPSVTMGAKPRAGGVVPVWSSSQVGTEVVGVSVAVVEATSAVVCADVVVGAVVTFSDCGPHAAMSITRAPANEKKRLFLMSFVN